MTAFFLFQDWLAFDRLSADEQSARLKAARHSGSHPRRPHTSTDSVALAEPEDCYARISRPIRQSLHRFRPTTTVAALENGILAHFTATVPVPVSTANPETVATVGAVCEPSTLTETHPADAAVDVDAVADANADVTADTDADMRADAIADALADAVADVVTDTAAPALDSSALALHLEALMSPADLSASAAAARVAAGVASSENTASEAGAVTEKDSTRTPAGGDHAGSVNASAPPTSSTPAAIHASLRAPETPPTLLPKAETNRVQQQHTPPAPPLEIVEDNPYNRMLLHAVCQYHGLESTSETRDGARVTCVRCTTLPWQPSTLPLAAWLHRAGDTGLALDDTPLLVC